MRESNPLAILVGRCVPIGQLSTSQRVASNGVRYHTRFLRGAFDAHADAVNEGRDLAPAICLNHENTWIGGAVIGLSAYDDGLEFVAEITNDQNGALLEAAVRHAAIAGIKPAVSIGWKAAESKWTYENGLTILDIVRVQHVGEISLLKPGTRPNFAGTSCEFAEQSRPQSSPRTRSRLSDREMIREAAACGMLPAGSAFGIPRGHFRAAVEKRLLSGDRSGMRDRFFGRSV